MRNMPASFALPTLSRLRIPSLAPFSVVWERIHIVHCALEWYHGVCFTSCSWAKHRMTGSKLHNYRRNQHIRKDSCPQLETYPTVPDRSSISPYLVRDRPLAMVTNANHVLTSFQLLERLSFESSWLGLQSPAHLHYLPVLIGVVGCNLSPAAPAR